MWNLCLWIEMLIFFQHYFLLEKFFFRLKCGWFFFFICKYKPICKLHNDRHLPYSGIYGPISYMTLYIKFIEALSCWMSFFWLSCWTDYLLREREKSKIFKDRDPILFSAPSSVPDKWGAHKKPKKIISLRSLTAGYRWEGGWGTGWKGKGIKTDKLLGTK